MPTTTATTPRQPASSRGPQQTPPTPDLVGFPGYLTTAQQRALEDFKTAVVAEGVLHDADAVRDWDFLRFLRAREFDVRGAVALLRADLEWRRQFEGKTLRAADFPACHRFLEKGLIKLAGNDKQGRVVLVVHASLVFPREVRDTEEIAKVWVAYVHEVVVANDGLSDRTDCTIIFDLANFSPSRNFSTTELLIVQIWQHYYVERIANVLVVNNPPGSRFLWNKAVGPLLEPRTASKVKFIAKLKQLQEYIAPDQLEAEYGGTHAPFPVPDAVTIKMRSEGILIKTGLFEELEDVSGSGSGAAAAAALGGGGKPPLPPRPSAASTSTSASATTDSTATLSTSPSKSSVARKATNVGMAAMHHQADRVRTMLAKLHEMRQVAYSSAAPSSAMPSGGAGGSTMRAELDASEPRAPRCAVFGATGRTGVEVVRLCLERGYAVCAFVRLDGRGLPPQLVKLAQEVGPERLSFVVGQVTDPNDVDRVVEASDVVISVMGSEPSLSMTAPGDWFPDAVEEIAKAMVRCGTRRLVLVTAAHSKRMSTAVFDRSGTVRDNATRFMYWNAWYSHAAEAEKRVKAARFHSVVAPTFIRPAAVVDGSDATFVSEDDAYFVSSAAVDDSSLLSLGSASRGITRAALAKFIVDECVVSGAHVDKGVAVASLSSGA